MKWVIATVLDQTIGYLALDEGNKDNYGEWTTVHSQAKLFDNLADTTWITANDESVWIEEVLDEVEFCARPDTW